MSELNELEQITALAQRGVAAASPNEAGERRARAHFLERTELELGQTKRPKWGLLWAAPAFAVALVLLWVFVPRSLDYEVEGAPRDGSYVRALNDRPATVRFADDTTLIAASGSRLRIEHARASSARVLVERGRADVHVVHATGRDWTFVAGPFEVLVTGTRFALNWDPLAETFEVSVSEGSVEVRGPTGSGPLSVHAGERFRGDVQNKRRVVSPSAGGDVPTSSAAAPASATPESLPSAAPRREGRSAGSAALDWQARMTRGEFAAVVADAEARGVSQCLTGCAAGDLRALSDAARYTGKTGLAEQSLIALRERFGSGAGRDAAFSLGRLFEQRGDLGQAERWYATYLREAPSGAFAAEALAGKMRVVKKQRGTSAAAPLAREYLQRFPKGVHGATAREILGEN